MANNRVIAGAMMVTGSLLASGFLAGDAHAQYESVGKPLQLVPQAYSSGSTATPRARVAAKKAARSEPKPLTRSAARSEPTTQSRLETKVETTQHISLHRKHAPRTDVAQQRHFRRPVAIASAETAAVRAAAAAVAPPPPPQPTPAPAPTAAQANAGELVVGGQAVQVRSPEEANELDLAANAISPPPSPRLTAPAPSAAAPTTSGPLYNLAAPTPTVATEAPPTGSLAPTPLNTAPPISTATPAPAATAPAADATKVAQADLFKAVEPQAKSPIGSASWIMQIMAALGGAIAAGLAAWYLIGSAAPRIKLSDWEEADGEA